MRLSVLQIIPLFFLSSILSEPAKEEIKKPEAPNENKEEIKKPKIPQINMGKGKPINIGNSSNIHRPGNASRMEFDPKRAQRQRMIDPLDISKMSTAEMDRYLACSLILTKRMDEVKDEVNKTAQSLGFSFEHLYQKISFSLLVGCSKKISNYTVQKYFKELIFSGDKVDDKDMELVPLNLSTFTKDFNMTITEEETILALKFEKIKHKYENKRMDAMKNKKNSILVFGYDIEDFGNGIKIGVFFATIAFITFGIIFMLKKLQEKNIKSKKNKDKKKKK